jgi:hypothetical protein
MIASTRWRRGSRAVVWLREHAAAYDSGTFDCLCFSIRVKQCGWCKGGGGGGVSNRTKDRTNNRGMPRLCHDMCVLMFRRAVVDADVQSWPRATRGLCRVRRRREPGRPGWTVSRSRVSHKAARGGHARPDGTVATVLFRSSVHDRRPAPGIGSKSQSVSSSCSCSRPTDLTNDELRCIQNNTTKT